MTEQSIFIQYFGDYPLIRILDFLIYSRDFDYPITEIAKNADVNFQTLKKVWPMLVKNEVVMKTRTLGGADLFKINERNLFVQKLIDLNNVLCMAELEKSRQKVVA